MQESLEAAYAACADTLYKIAMVYLGSPADAEDVLQDAFLKLLCRREAFQDPEHRKRWLIRVTVNLCKDRLRGFWRRRVVPFEGQIIVQDEEKQEIWEQVLAMPETYKAVMHLYYYEGYAVQEIAKILGLSTGAVKTRLHRGRKALRMEMEEEP